MRSLPDKPILADYRAYLAYHNKLRGFEETVPEVFMLLTEEVGEFAKAARKHSGVKRDRKSSDHDVNEEAADVFYLLINLCIKLDIDLEKAFRSKEKKNQKRKWS